MPRYQQIARQLKNAIEKGELKPGTRLPSSRTWAQELGVSRSTVENAQLFVNEVKLKRQTKTTT